MVLGFAMRMWLNVEKPTTPKLSRFLMKNMILMLTYNLFATIFLARPSLDVKAMWISSSFPCPRKHGSYFWPTVHMPSEWTICKKAELLCGKKLGTTWVCTFLKRHPEIVLVKPSGLDPKHAQAFNHPPSEKCDDLSCHLLTWTDQVCPSNIDWQQLTGLEYRIWCQLAWPVQSSFPPTGQCLSDINWL